MTNEQPSGVEPTDRTGSPGSRRRRPLGPLAKVGVVLALLTIAVLVFVDLTVRAYRIPSASMTPTLQINQRILVTRLETHPGIGAIVVFHPPAGAAETLCTDPAQGSGHDQACDRVGTEDPSQTFVKRVVGLPGDHIDVRSGQVWRNGREERASYAQVCNGEGCDYRTPIVVPAGTYFMMGDNREDSDDSRFWGPVPQKWIIGQVFFSYAPLGRIGFL